MQTGIIILNVFAAIWAVLGLVFMQAPSWMLVGLVLLSLGLVGWSWKKREMASNQCDAESRRIGRLVGLWSGAEGLARLSGPTAKATATGETLCLLKPAELRSFSSCSVRASRTKLLVAPGSNVCQLVLTHQRRPPGFVRLQPPSGTEWVLGPAVHPISFEPFEVFFLIASTVPRSNTFLWAEKFRSFSLRVVH